jgi:hypothetical protein
MYNLGLHVCCDSIPRRVFFQRLFIVFFSRPSCPRFALASKIQVSTPQLWAVTRRINCFPHTRPPRGPHSSIFMYAIDSFCVGSTLGWDFILFYSILNDFFLLTAGYCVWRHFPRHNGCNPREWLTSSGHDCTTYTAPLEFFRIFFAVMVVFVMVLVALLAY